MFLLPWYRKLGKSSTPKSSYKWRGFIPLPAIEGKCNIGFKFLAFVDSLSFALLHKVKGIKKSVPFRRLVVSCESMKRHKVGPFILFVRLKIATNPISIHLLEYHVPSL